MGIFNKIFKQKPAANPPLKEIAETFDDFYFTTNGSQERFNPDVLLQRKGWDVYRRMMRDAQVKSAYNLMIDILISRNFRFERTSDDPTQQKIEDFFYHNLENLRSTWTQAMRSVLLAKAHGFSISEKIYKVGKFEGKDKWMIDAIKPKPFETFTFDADKFGNIRYLIQEQSSKEAKLNPSKFIIYVNFPELDPLYGESDLRAIYRPYWEKDNILKFWNIHLERVAGGFTVAQAEQGAPILSAAEKNDFDNVLKNISAATAIRVPTGYKIDVVNGINTDAFEKAVMHRDKQIAKGLMIPNLLGFSEQGTAGSFAQSQTQLETFFFVINQQGELLADCLNEQLFQELAWWNFGTDEFPRFTFEKFTDIQKREIAMAWSDAVQKGVVKNTFEDEQRTRELLSYDPREQDEEDEEKPAPAPEPKKEPEEKEDIPDDPEELQTMAEDESEDPRIMRRINFSEYELSFADNEENFFDRLSVDIDNMLEDVEEAVSFVFKRLSDKNTVNPEEEIAKLDTAITPKTKSAMNQTVRKFLRLSYDDGRSIAQDVIAKAADEAPSENLSERIRTAATLSKRYATEIKREDQKRLRWYEHKWSVRDFVEGLNLDTAERYFMAKAFWITGDVSKEIQDAAKLVILNGIRDELTLDEIIIELKDILSPLTGKIDPETGRPMNFERPRLETIIRTNLSDAFTQAQLAVYNDPDLGDFVRALKYSAILDNRTSPFCKSTNGNIYLKNDPIWGTITPPNHFNCRSVVIPVTEFDDFRTSAKPTESPSKGFGGGVQFLNSELKEDV